MEVVRETTTYVATLDLNEVNEYEPDDDIDNFFMIADWTQKSSEVISSDEYKIVRKQDDKTVKEVFDVPDVVKFILHEMDTCI